MRLSGATLIQPIDRDCPHHRIVDENSFNNHITGTELVLMEYSFVFDGDFITDVFAVAVFMCMYLFYRHCMWYCVLFHDIMVFLPYVHLFSSL